MLIPLSDQAKGVSDTAVVSGSLLGFFKVIPWPEIAAFLACLYTAGRIIEMLLGWWRKK